MPSHIRGLIDTSVVIDLQRIPASKLPAEIAIAAVTLAELAAGPHATADAHERARRQERLQRAEALFVPIPFDVHAARAYGSVYATAISAGRSVRARIADYLIAATAIAAGLALFTRNLDDFAHLRRLLEIVEV